MRWYCGRSGMPNLKEFFEMIMIRKWKWLERFSEKEDNVVRRQLSNKFIFLKIFLHRFRIKFKKLIRMRWFTWPIAWTFSDHFHTVLNFVLFPRLLLLYWAVNVGRYIQLRGTFKKWETRYSYDHFVNLCLLLMDFFVKPLTFVHCNRPWDVTENVEVNLIDGRAVDTVIK